MKFLIPFIVFGLTLVSCNNSSNNKTMDINHIEQVALHIEGMSCEKMCGGAICKGLEKLDGVNTTKLTFNSDNPVDMVTVTFDPSQITSEEIKSKVESIAGGIYKVREVK